MNVVAENVNNELNLQMKICDVGDLHAAAKIILNQFPDDKVFAFYGPMGAGKTTFIKEFCRELGCIGSLSSPTFSIMNEYQNPNGTSVMHFDFYRIKHLNEVYDLGYEDFFFDQHYCFTEWSEKIEPLLNFGHVKIIINPEEHCRAIKVIKHEQANA
ncbi:MAG TPA: tRNA (adenosine(37)-N6)-threonylcarbamoyltransferase complex ATPase subunit type 1 TsaE [Bacteroidia bacterium]|nr:tRNA (adenosine(37)-N6)-threonylcarbamoyltransferase complex ATPase subunit type 1 TsaE [Bacteroidia bacterium]HNT80416.1 tRNA (adenosine(37)-N6)-threonylcarbamoyltransferase complex ATPase subunit type 1 TsaE [Bacteroidia bacterium]